MSGEIKTNRFDLVLYETRPFSLFIIGVYSVQQKQSIVMAIAGITLLVSVALISRLRLRHRGYIR